VNRDSRIFPAGGCCFHWFELAPDANRFQVSFAKHRQKVLPPAFQLRAVRVFRGSPK